VILNIAFKEFYNNLLTARFTIGFIMCLFLIPFSLVVNLKDYREQLKGYEIERVKTEKSYQVRVYSALRPEIVRPPEPLSIFSKGISGTAGNKFKIRLDNRWSGAEGYETGRENPLLMSFFTMDFCTILVYILSLFAMLFTYDACSGERESGTLKLVLANPVHRWKVLIGKLIGVCLTLLPVIIFCFLLSALIVLLAPQVSFSAGEWLRVALLFLVSMVFFGLFILIGLLFSCCFRASAASIVLCLFVWVLSIFIIPNLANSLAKSLVAAPDNEDNRTVTEQLNREMGKKITEHAQSLRKQRGFDIFYWSGTGGEDGYFETAGGSRNLMDYYRLYYEFVEPLRIEYEDKNWVKGKEFGDKLEAQRKLANRLALLSPTDVFRQVSETLCRTDNDTRLLLFDESLVRYRDDFIGYLKEKNVFSSYEYFTRQPPETFMSYDEIVRVRSGGQFNSAAEYIQWRKDGGDRSPLDKVPIPGSEITDYPPLELTDMPIFEFKSPSMLGGLRQSMGKIAGIIGVELVLFFLTFVCFVRYDVR
jgi:ABC-type transport system involved in multi-copper enzyme maturation permease subunit